MAFLHRSPAVDPDIELSRDMGTDGALAPGSSTPVPLTRASAAWMSVAAASLMAVLVIVFLAQNTQPVRVHFLWMSTSTSLALMLLITAVAAVLLTVILGTARMVQLRKLIREQVAE
jgi:uncharacterized integral membrane protein